MRGGESGAPDAAREGARSGRRRPGVDPARETGTGLARDAGPRAEAVAYGRYVRSAAWHGCEARREELRLSGRRCRLCDRGSPEVRLEVHHRSYRRLGRERARDLTTLCSDCHGVVTDMLRRRRYAHLALPSLSDTPRVLPRREVGTAAGRAP